MVGVFLSVVLFLCSPALVPGSEYAAVGRWMVPPLQDMAAGRVWGLLSAGFVHANPVPFLIGLYWFWLFGSLIELREGTAFWLLFLLSASLAGAVAQLAFSGDTGTGFSGIVYAGAGFLWVRRRHERRYRAYLRNGVLLLFLAWLLVCGWAGRTGRAGIASIAAPLGGLGWGALLGAARRFRPLLRWAAGIAGLALLGLLWRVSPLAVSREYLRALRFQEKGRLAAAEAVYERILARDTTDEFAQDGLRQIRLYGLEQEAYRLHLRNDTAAARRAYRQILQVDSGNVFATENLKALDIGR